MEIAEAVPYIIEGGKDIPYKVEEGVTPISELFDLSSTDFHYFRDTFLESPHINVVCQESPQGPMILSLKQNEDGNYTCLLRTKAENRRLQLNSGDIQVPFFRNLFRLGPTPKSYLKATTPSFTTGRVKVVNKPDLPAKLLDFEQKQTIKGFKFGVIYCGPGQVREDEIFTNEHGSPEFEEFLDFLGDRVELEGWDKYRAGLDVTNGSTGEHSIFLEFNNNQIMFHVSTLLPHNPLDKQQLEKKRHIGNDLVVVIFQEGDQVYRPTTLSSRQVQVVFLIKPELIDGDRYYRLAIIRRREVPPFNPALPDDSLFKSGPEFHEFLLKKLLNAEKAAYKTEVIASKLQRTRNALLGDLGSNYF